MFQQPQQQLGMPAISNVSFGGRSQQAASSSSAQQARPYSPGALDVLNAERARLQQPPIQGTEDVRSRDTYYHTERRSPTNASATFAARSLDGPSSMSQSMSFEQQQQGQSQGFSSTGTVGLKKFESTRTNTLRPVIFQPNGSFRALKENGKLAVGPEEASVYKGRVKNPLAETAYMLPGYTGFVRGSQHISGRTYGETTRRALCTDYREVVCSSPIPSAPQANRKIRHEDLQDTFVANMFGGKTYQIPGYTGFVPGVRSTYAKRYGAATEQEMLAHSVRFPRRDNQSNTFARTQLPRESYPLLSAPLPGGALSQAPPDMYIPEHVRYLKFFPM